MSDAHPTKLKPNRENDATKLPISGRDALLVSGAVCGAAGQLGSPSATTTIDGAQLPAPAPKFGGVIENNAMQSKEWWQPRIVPPQDAPNILLIMTDDAGFGVIAEQATGFPAMTASSARTTLPSAAYCVTTATRRRGSARTTIRRRMKPARLGRSINGRPHSV